MKTKNWACYILDTFAAVAIGAAGITLVGTLVVAGSLTEPLLLLTFSRCFAVGLGSFALARLIAIGALLAKPREPLAQSPLALPDNVDKFPSDRIKRAA
ncbi:MAG: hypothetical protein AAF384_05220 [Pseudomonadota bacterium]